MSSVINTATYGNTVWKYLEEEGATFGVAIDAKKVRDAVLKAVSELMPTPTNVPTGDDIIPYKPHNGTADKALPLIRKLYSSQGVGSISLTLLGESHNNATDRQRALQVINEVGAGDPVPTLMFYERYLYSGERNPTTQANGPYPWPGDDYAGRKVSELSLSYASGTIGANFFGEQLNIEGRSALVAGYLALTTGGGDQQQTDRVLLFFGGEHADILDKYEHYTKHYAPWTVKRARTYFIINSSGG